MEENLKDLEGRLFTPQELLEEFGNPLLYLNQFVGFAKEEYRIIATKQDDGNYKISEVYKP